MKIKLFPTISILVLIVFVLVIMFSQKFQLLPKHKNPKIFLPKGKLYDFGTAMEGENIEHSFIIKNIGATELKILNITTGCGCTDAKLKSKKIAPGGTCKIDVTYHARRVQYRDTVNVVVETNDPENRFLEFLLTGFIKYYVFWRPESISFYGKEGNINKPKDIKFSTKGRSELQLDIVSISSKFIDAKIIKTDHGPILRITLSPQCPKGARTEKILIKCLANEFNRQIAIPVYIMLN